MQVDVTHLGSSASNFMPISNLFTGGSTACLKQLHGAASLFVSYVLRNDCDLINLVQDHFETNKTHTTK